MACDRALAVAERRRDVRLVPSLASHRSGLLLAAASAAAARPLDHAARARQTAAGTSDAASASLWKRRWRPWAPLGCHREQSTRAMRGNTLGTPPSYGERRGDRRPGRWPCRRRRPGGWSSQRRRDRDCPFVLRHGQAARPAGLARPAGRHQPSARPGTAATLMSPPPISQPGCRGRRRGGAVARSMLKT